jgi:hypothetical protein
MVFWDLLCLRYLLDSWSGDATLYYALAIWMGMKDGELDEERNVDGHLDDAQTEYRYRTRRRL